MFCEGLKNLDLRNWIELDETYLIKYHLKKHLFLEHRKEVLQVLPGCEEGLFEALALLVDFLIKRYPMMFSLVDEHTIENLVTGDIWDIDPNAATWEKYHPLEVMGLLATDDFFILQTDPYTSITTLRAGGVCFPGQYHPSSYLSAY